MYSEYSQYIYINIDQLGGWSDLYPEQALKAPILRLFM